MILLDTHVVSESLKLSGDVGVMTWIDAQIIETLYLSTISLAELRFATGFHLTAGQAHNLHGRPGFTQGRASPGSHYQKGV